MKLLEEKILKEGKVLSSNVLKVDSFLNHQLDVAFINELGEEFKRLFAKELINKILTIESSGIGIAALVAQHFDNCPVVFAKKKAGINHDGDFFHTKVESFTHKCVYNVMVSKAYLHPGDHVLIIDDFLAHGHAVIGLMDIVHQSGAVLEGVGIAIEKASQMGGSIIRKKGVHLESLAIIESMHDGVIKFKDNC